MRRRPNHCFKPRDNPPPFAAKERFCLPPSSSVKRVAIGMIESSSRACHRFLSTPILSAVRWRSCKSVGFGDQSPPSIRFRGRSLPGLRSRNQTGPLRSRSGQITPSINRVLSNPTRHNHFCCSRHPTSLTIGRCDGGRGILRLSLMKVRLPQPSACCAVSWNPVEVEGVLDASHRPSRTSPSRHGHLSP